ncbi:TonB-linked outer membrane protein, SusC/RagA family [Fodinibius salinus]|uniref:TonB-linked outer membrane protein, SusC/RagA family n=1 Tax=Fodinibius salinus TaxID=860790 RepID=A0A5D3YMT4_9BACT|nr:SusC/RagA family TonB-linked outer membrane protein [Fodinibius salinus]TYP94027.1 TonB-linked outer membrane protein, SusC/RagA family [Fodinibius salinus]
MVKKILSLFTFCLIFSASAFAQTGTITGTVTDQSSGETLPSVNIFIVDTQQGTATNPDGEYTIKGVEYGTYTIRASFVGYKTVEQKVTVDQSTVNLDFSLSASTQELEDVVVTAYGVEKEVNDLPYSAQSVDTEQISETGSDDFISALSGRVSGLKVQSASGMGGSTDIVLRGYNSLTGNNQVLFVVDGVPYANNRFNSEATEEGSAGYDYGSTGVDINPDNIASMNVLKGPAAAALYGSRASNGAIVIETKKGTPGQKDVEVQFKSSVGVNMMNSNTFPTYQKEYGAGYVPSFFSEDINGDGNPDEVARYTADASFGPAFDSNRMVYQWESLYSDNPQPEPWTAAENMPSEFFETGTNVQNSISINGGISDGGYYNIGYSQSNIRGMLPNSELDKYKLNFKGGYQVSDKVTVSASINYSKTSGQGRPERGYSTIMSEFRQWWQTNVDIEKQRQSYFRNRKNNTWNLTSDKAGAFYWNNPYFEQYENYASDERDRYVGSAEVKYEVVDWLSFTGRVALDSYNQLIEERQNVNSVGVSSYFRQTESFSEYNFDLLANFNKRLNESVAIDGVVGANIRRSYTEGISASTTGGLLVPGLYSLDNSASSIQYPGETDRKLGVNGYFAQLNVNYNDYLNLSLTGRRDKSSSLPDGENVYYYPSASLGFTFSEFLNNDLLSFGKIRGSWSEVGNTAPAFSLQDTYQRPSNFGSAGRYTLPSTKNNPDLKPERTKSWEVGLQLGFIQDRIFIDASYYDENTIDQILPVNVSAASGYTSQFVNAGNVENRGVEVSFTGIPVQSRNLRWSITANWSKNVNTVKALAPNVNYYELASPQGGVSIGALEGGPYGAIRGSDFINVDGNPVNQDGGEPVVGPGGYYQSTTTSNNVIGNMNPDWRGSISNTVNVQNWTLDVLVDVRWGGDIFSLDQWYGQGTGLYPVTAGLNDKGNPKRDPVAQGGGARLDGVQADGSKNDVYAPVNYAGPYGYFSNPSAAYIYDGSYVKLREVGITYNLPQSLINKSGVLTSASISAKGRNLWIIHKNIPHADPEQNLAGSNVQGYQGGNLPSARNVTLNLKLNF